MERDVGRTDAELTFNVKASWLSERFHTTPKGGVYKATLDGGHRKGMTACANAKELELKKLGKETSSE